MSRFLQILILNVLATSAGLALSACVVGDGEFQDPPRRETCLAYPDNPEKCGQPWSGRVVQNCDTGSVITTSLRFDRPSVTDSLRANTIVLGHKSFGSFNWSGSFTDTTVVCDGGLCREYAVMFRPYGMPIIKGTGYIEFWGYDSSFGSYDKPADAGLITLDTTLFGSCP